MDKNLKMLFYKYRSYQKFIILRMYFWWYIQEIFVQYSIAESYAVLAIF